MRIMLINPPRFNNIPVVREIRCAGTSPVSIFPPIDLAYIASYIRAKKIDTAIELLDANGVNMSWEGVKKRIQQFNPDIVLFKSSPTTMAHDIFTATIAKKFNPQILTILDDAHIAPILPEQTLREFKDIDILIRGESERTLELLLEKLPNKLSEVTGISYREGNEIVSTEATPPLKNLDTLPFPAYDMLPVGSYESITFAKKKPFMTIITSRGCPFKCDFCIVGGSTVWRGSGDGWYSRTADNILDEIQLLVNDYGVKEIYFFDETFTVNKNRVLEVCEGLDKRGIKISWSCNSRIDTLDDEMLKAMKKAGCWNILFGVESGSQEILNNCHKKIKLDDIKRVFKMTKTNGIHASGSFMVGLPGENWNTIEQTLQLALEIEPDYCQFVITSPYPGTRLYDYVKTKSYLIKDYKFSGYDAYGLSEEPVLRTDELSSEDLVKARKYIHRKFYLRPKYILKRLLSLRSLTEVNMMFRGLKYVLS